MLRHDNYRKHLDYLIAQGIIETDNWYITGEKSKGYRFTATYKNKIEATEIKKYTLVKSIKAKGSYERNMKIKYDYLHKWFDQRLTIDFESAEKHLEVLYWNDIKNETPNPLVKYNARLSNLIKIEQNDLYFRVDETSGRLHTNLSVLKKELRNFISFENQPLSSIDIRCSQPTLV